MVTESKKLQAHEQAHKSFVNTKTHHTTSNTQTESVQIQY